MTPRMGAVLAAAVIVTTGICIDVGRQARAAAARRHQPVAVSTPATTRTFADPKGGISVDYPSAWRPRPAKTAELSVGDPAGIASLQLDVPAMAWHPPFIPIGMVASRYEDALRQDGMADAAVQETADLKVAGATARRATARGHAKGGGACVDTAVVIVHGGQIYILSCDSGPAGAATARRALDAAVASVRWTK